MYVYLSWLHWVRYVQGDKYSTIVFDTAPTGHTLRLLSFPSILEKALNKLMAIKARFSGIFSQVPSLLSRSVRRCSAQPPVSLI
jgi:arsenite-transporting ATPase